MLKRILIIVALGLLPLQLTLADTDQSGPYVGSPSFEKMKSLAGVWRGTSSGDGNKDTVEVQYKVTSAGSALLETLFPGKPYEMVSVYKDNKGKLGMTHYCSLKNQPSMKMKSTGKNRISFVYSDGANLDPKKDNHMHALEVEFINANKIIQKWTGFEKGKPSHTNIITLSRK